jgi:hypothetical protein
MKIFVTKWVTVAFVTLLVIGAGLTSVSPAQAAPLRDAATDCVVDGGTWIYEGVFAYFNLYRCFFSSGHAAALAVCGPGYDVSYYYGDLPPLTFLGGPACDLAGGSSPAPSGGSSYVGSVEYHYPPYGQSGAQTNGSNEEEVTLCLSKGKNGCVNFEVGACQNNCTISATLPVAAADALPAGALAKLYIRPIDENGEPSASGYTVCFDNPDGAEVVIYKFAGGEWVALTFSSTADSLCTTSSGEGAFYLGSLTST